MDETRLQQTRADLDTVWEYLRKLRDTALFPDESNQRMVLYAFLPQWLRMMEKLLGASRAIPMGHDEKAACGCRKYVVIAHGPKCPEGDDDE